MSTEQSEQGETQPAQSQVDITQQATTPKPTSTQQQRVKNPKRVAAGKLVAERTRLAREQQKKAAAEAAIIIANNKAKASNTVAAPEPDLPAPDSNCVAAAYCRRKHQRVPTKLIVAFSAPPNGLLLPV